MARHDTTKKLSEVPHQGDTLVIRNMSEKGGTENMRSFWEEKVYMIVENINNKNVM